MGFIGSTRLPHTDHMQPVTIRHLLTSFENDVQSETRTYLVLIKTVQFYYYLSSGGCLYLVQFILYIQNLNIIQ